MLNWHRVMAPRRGLPIIDTHNREYSYDHRTWRPLPALPSAGALAVSYLPGRGRIALGVSGGSWWRLWRPESVLDTLPALDPMAPDLPLPQWHRRYFETAAALAGVNGSESFTVRPWEALEPGRLSAPKPGVGGYGFHRAGVVLWAVRTSAIIATPDNPGPTVDIALHRTDDVGITWTDVDVVSPYYRYDGTTDWGAWRSGDDTAGWSVGASVLPLRANPDGSMIALIVANFFAYRNTSLAGSGTVTDLSSGTWHELCHIGPAGLTRLETLWRLVDDVESGKVSNVGASLPTGGFILQSGDRSVAYYPPGWSGDAPVVTTNPNSYTALVDVLPTGELCTRPDGSSSSVSSDWLTWHPDERVWRTRHYDKPRRLDLSVGRYVEQPADWARHLPSYQSLIPPA